MKENSGLTIAIPTVKFKSNVTEVIDRLTAAYENLMRIRIAYGISPDESYVFDATSFNVFVCRLCEEHFKCFYSKKGVSKTFARRVKGDFRKAFIVALNTKKSSERMSILSIEVSKLPNAA